jgi:glycosyltransferase 2 family protein
MSRTVAVPSATTAVAPAPIARPTRRVWVGVRLLGGVAILSLLLWRAGTGPFLDGVRSVDAPALVAAFGIGVVVTVGCAWRWSLIAAGLGVRLPLREAVAAYYRSQFLNTALPGGILGDVHRATRHGLDIGDVGLGVRAAVLDRVAGQAVQIPVAVVVLLFSASPVRRYLPLAALIVVVVGVVAILLALAARGRGSDRVVRLARAIGSDMRHGLFAGGAWISVTAASAVIVAGHVATFVIAARVAGSTAGLGVLLPLMLLVLLATAIPLNIAGWGPREGAAAWAFGAAGLTTAQGLAASVTFGVLVFVASLPGAAVLLIRWLHRRPAAELEGGRG